jgi:ribosomal protein L11 methyltransferase
MTSAQFSLTIANLAHDEALRIADEIDTDIVLDAIAVIVNETDETRNLWEAVAYFQTRDEAEQAKARRPQPSQILTLPDVDWVRRSLQGLAPVTAGRFYLHGSHDRKTRKSGSIAVEIDAGTAFGTGHHGTTAGCLIALDAILKRRKPRRIFDLGCGTGVLAIAAAKATRRRCLATDIDAEAVRVTLRNAALNGVKPLIAGRTATGLRHHVIANAAPFDLVFANILARPLAQLADGLTRILAPGGELVLSGLTLDQTHWITACYRNRGLNRVSEIHNGNWAALVMQKPGAS